MAGLRVQDLRAPEPINLEVAEFSEETKREVGITHQHEIAGFVEDGRERLQKARKLAKEHGEDDLYLWLSRRVGELDGLQCRLAERGAGS